MPNSNLLPSLLFKINQNQLALEAAIMNLALGRAAWIGRCWSNVRGTLDTICKNEELTQVALAVLMTPE